jgi:DNA-binding transcriptional ArsR family regulator
MSDPSELQRENLYRIFSALGSPVRLRILAIICETKRPLHIKAVAEVLQMDYAAVYRHVGILKKARLVQIFEVGRSRVLSPLHADLIEQVFALAQRIEE